VHVAGGTVSSSQAVSICLIVTELVINALKHGFAGDRSDSTAIVAYDLAKPKHWQSSVIPCGSFDRSAQYDGGGHDAPFASRLLAAV
jgi:hypothetical protein